MKDHVMTGDGIKISIRHSRKSMDKAVIVAPGFFQSKETATFRRIEEFLSTKYDVISMDFRGHGNSGGRYTFSARETRDLHAVVNYAREHYDRIGILGFSYGGAIAILEQARHKSMDSLICVGSPMASQKIEMKWWHPESIRSGIHGMEKGAGVRMGNPFLKKTNAIDVVSQVSPTPILFIHSESDATVGLRHSIEMHQKASEPKRLKIVEKGGHAQEIFRRYPEEFSEIVLNWFDRTL